ncbi:hypothetical protein CXB51_029927 [Gossypium anomalum]|uniref:RNase H type-1 domain-containing protein n=1 Tax=Gossypium anomalum TaxID=47600 RepID=A0A8J5Y8B5_9ROSI|nr:hypothetical protein CXB51_029927 [Gossypium anomalum]
MIQCTSWAISLNSASHRIANHSFQVCWSPSSLGWTKLNGAVRLDSSRASASGLLRDSNGDWLFGFCRNIGCCSAYEAELWGIIDWLTLAWQRGCR